MIRSWELKGSQMYGEQYGESAYLRLGHRKWMQHIYALQAKNSLKELNKAKYLTLKTNL